MLSTTWFTRNRAIAAVVYLQEIIGYLCNPYRSSEQFNRSYQGIIGYLDNLHRPSKRLSHSSYMN